MEERLQKFLSNQGVCSRRKAEEYILAGKVKVNGEVVTELGTKINTEADKIEFEDKVVSNEVKKVYVVERKDALKKGVQAYYNTNLEGLKIYTFELNNQKVVQLALNQKISDMVDIYYKQKFKL